MHSPGSRGSWRRSGSDGSSRSQKAVNLRQEVPPEVADLVRDRGVEPRLSVRADIEPTGRLGQCWLVADPTRLLVIVPNGGQPEVELDLDLAGVRAFRVDSFVGSQALTAEVAADDREVVRFTTAEAARFSKVRHRLEAWRKGEVDPDEENAESGDGKPDKVDKRQALLRLLKYLRPHLGKLAALLSLVLISDGLGLLGPLFNGFMVDNIMSPGKATGRQAGQYVAWLVTADTRTGMLSQIILYLFILQVLGTTLGVVRGRIGAWLGYYVVHDIRSELYTHLQTLTLRYFDQRQTGAVMSRVTQDTRAMQGFLVDGAQDLIANVLKLIVTGTLLLTINWKLALLTIVPAPLVAFFATAWWRKLRIVYGRLWQSWERLNATLQDSLSGVRVVKAFAGEARETQRFNLESGRVAEAGSDANKLRATIFPWIGFSIHLSTLVIWLFGGWQVISGEMSFGSIMTFLMYLYMFYGPMQYVSGLFNWFNETIAAADRVWEVLDEQPDVPEPTSPDELESIEGRFSFDHVTFGYVSHEPVLHDICLEVEPGEMIGLVGHSGAGKSTLINLICRFYDVDEGTIRVDDHDIRTLPSREFRKHIGVVLQDNFLFSGSIFENITYGNPDATLEEVIAAAHAANAHDFICRFPDGYDSLVGERGTRLSGGERQRISIARAVLHNPTVLILDEATASVDTETERQIQDALRRLIKGRTTFAIAHRLSTLRNADRLVVLEKGRIVEVGTHDELMSKEDGVFRRLVDMQSELNRLTHIGG